MGPEFFPLPQSFDLAQTLELDSHLHGRNSPAFLKEISMRITLMEWKRTSWATKTQAHIHFIAARENQELSLLVTANFQYLRPFEENTTAHEVAFAENFQPESDQASGFHYTLPGITEEKGTRSTTAGDAAGKTQPVRHATGQTDWVPTETKCKAKEKRWREIYKMNET